MPTHPVALDHMLAAWQELSPEKVRSHLDAALSPTVHFVDPDNDIRGIDAFEEMVHAFRKRFPSAELSRASGVDGHHDLYRYDWAIHVDGNLLMPGFDVSELDDEGRVLRVLGFFGPLPEKNGA